MPLRTADLHFHSTHSDGKHSVEELAQIIKSACEADLDLAVLTDHDGVYGFEEYAEALEGWMPIVCGAEFSCSFVDPVTRADRELHLLVYGLDPKDELLREKFIAFKDSRKTRFLKICENLKAAGYDIDGESLAKKYDGTLGRPHIADALIEKGYASSRQDAFKRFLHDGNPLVEKKWRIPLEDAMAAAKKRGWKTSIAHPGQYGFRAPHLEYFKALGVDAIEVFHPRQKQDQYLYYLEQSKKMGLMITGGSDFHALDSDQVSGTPSLGRTRYPIEQARRFLKGLI